jgi:hypothetical protein
MSRFVGQNTPFRGPEEGWVWFPRAWTRLRKIPVLIQKGLCGKGQKYLETITDKIADFYVELATQNR